MSSEPTDQTPLHMKQLGPSEGEPNDTQPEGKEIEDAPPKYAAVLGIAKMRKDVQTAKEKSPNQAVFFFKVCGMLSGSVLSLVCLLIFSALPIAMIVIGSLYIHDCSGERFIPIWLIVFGCFSLLQTLINTCRTICSCFQKDDDDGEGSRSGNYANRGGGCCECIILVFLFAWLIAGSVWVFRYYHVYYDLDCPANPQQVGCCDPVPFLFSFGSIIAIYALSLLSLIVLCCCFCCIACVAGIMGSLIPGLASKD